MNTRYFVRVDVELDPVSLEVNRRPITLCRLTGTLGEWYRGNGIWESEDDLYLFGMINLMESGWDKYDEISEAQVEEIAKILFPVIA